MKININIDCSADEARQFLGLPDVRPLQEALLADVKERLLASMHAMEPDALMRQWMPAGLSGMDQMQRAFWQAMTAAGGRKGEDQGS